MMPISTIAPPVKATPTDPSSACAEGVLTTPLPPVPDGFGFAGGFAGVLGYQLLAGGGTNFPDGLMPWDGGEKVWHDTLYSLDLSDPAGAWHVAGRLPKANGYGVSLTAPEGIIMIGGGDACRNFKEVWLITLSDDGMLVFKALPALSGGLAQMCAALVGRRVHLCGGIGTPDSTIASNAHWMLDLDALAQGWTEMPALPAAGRVFATAAVIDDTFYCMAGCSLAPGADGTPLRSYLRDAWKFSAGAWSRIADLPRPLVASASPAPVTGNSVFLVSGDDGSQSGLANRDDHTGFSKNVLRYDVDADTWARAGLLKTSPPVTVAVTPWNGKFIFFNGEVKPGVRTPGVFVLSLPGHE